MRTHQWREPTEAERALARDWVATWNSTTGDAAVLPDGWRAAKDCDCGCPTFAVTPIMLKQPDASQGPLGVDGSATNQDGTSLAGLVAFWADDVLHLEVYSLEGPMPSLDQLAFTLDVDPRLAHRGEPPPTSTRRGSIAPRISTLARLTTRLVKLPTPSRQQKDHQ